MAIDFGDRHTGVAISDISGFMAGEAFVINDWDEDRIAETIAAKAEERNAEIIVVGYPKNMDGTPGPRAEKCARFAKQIEEKAKRPVALWDERRTTIDAHRILQESGKNAKKRKKTVDAVAASLILEGYLEYLRNKGR